MHFLLLLLVSCKEDNKEDSSITLAGPELSIPTPPGETIAGNDIPFSVNATDPDGVQAVTLYWRSADRDWGTLTMVPGEGDAWTATLAGTEVVAPEISYYIKGTDDAEVPSNSYLPAEATAAPYTVPVAVQGITLPYIESFEDISYLTEINWHSASSATRGYSWDITTASASEGSQGAWHPRGSASAGQIQDWLISPAMDFSTLSQISVSWYERGASIVSPNHQLYIGVGDSDPTDGGFTLVSALPAPTEEWARSAIYDLSAQAGNQAVYLAWYFDGENSDDWYMDQITVQALQPDVSIDLSSSPSTLSPGDSGTLSITLQNTTVLDANDLTITASFPEGGASAPDPAILASLAGNAQEQVDIPFTIDSATADNRYLPVHVDVSDGTSTWDWDGQILIGEASIATVDFTALQPGIVSFSMGVGDPDAPLWEQTVYSGNATGNMVWTEDVTDQGDYLPPVAGPERWFLRVSPQTSGTLNSFTLSYDGQTYTSTSLTVLSGQEDVVQLPEPPSFTLSSASAGSLSPGSTGALVSVTARNVGASTQGIVYGTLVSTHPDLNVSSAGPVALSAGVVSRAGTVSGSGVFTIDVAATHTDSNDVTAELQLTDGVDSWALPVSFAVPYPVPRITAIDINDDGGDGILDPGESAQITLDVTNVGDLSCNGTVHGVLALAGSSTAVATVGGDSEILGTLSAGRTQDARFDVSVDAGAVAGQSLDLELTLTDNDRSYVVPTTLILGEPPWQSLNATQDSVGDAQNGWQFDIVGGQYRVYNGQLQIQLESYAPYDPATLFIEIWGNSNGAAYDYYQIVLQSNIATLRSYDGNFHDIGVPGFSYPSPTTVELDLELADMALALDQVSFGFASGWCGTPDYCDQFPDYWGYPYTGWSPSLWFDLSW